MSCVQIGLFMELNQEAWKHTEGLTCHDLESIFHFTVLPSPVKYSLELVNVMRMCNMAESGRTHLLVLLFRNITLSRCLDRKRHV